MVAALTLGAVAAAIASVARIAVAHPAAAADSSHVFAVLFAMALAGYLAFALTASSRSQATAAGDVLVGLVLYPLVLSLVALTAVTLVGAGAGRGSGHSVTNMLR